MSRATPMQRSRDKLASEGYHVETVEQNRRTIGRVWKTDLWGFADLLCVRRGEVLAVQVTSASNVAARVKKIAESELAPKVREAGVRIVVHGWRQQGGSKTRAGEWVCVERDLS